MKLSYEKTLAVLDTLGFQVAITVRAVLVALVAPTA
jgi:hypothetical protein